MSNKYQNYRLKRKVFVWTVLVSVLLFSVYFFVLNSIQARGKKLTAQYSKHFQSLTLVNKKLHKLPTGEMPPKLIELFFPEELQGAFKDYQKALNDLKLISVYLKGLEENLHNKVERQDLQKLYIQQKSALQSEYFILAEAFHNYKAKSTTKLLKQNRFERQTLVIFAIFFILLINYLYRDLKKSFRKPVEALITGAEQIRAGNLDHLINVKEASQDDFGQLMRNFNMMARRISSMTGKLEQANLVLQDQSDNFEESAKQKVKFIRQLGHELRAPLSSIIGFSEMLKEGYYGEVEEKQKDYLERIHRSGETLLSMVNDLVDQAKLQTGTWRMEFDRYDVHKLVEEVYLEFEIIAEKAGVTLLFDEKSVSEMKAVIDRKLIRQLMVNLITNALKFSDDGGEVTLSLKELTAKKSWRFSVIDKGMGIPENELSKIFDEFHQVQSSYSSKGAGLGLPLCKKIAEMHSGKITVKSTPGEGSTFNLIVPVDPQPKQEGITVVSS